MTRKGAYRLAIERHPGNDVMAFASSPLADLVTFYGRGAPRDRFWCRPARENGGSATVAFFPHDRPAALDETEVPFAAVWEGVRSRGGLILSVSSDGRELGLWKQQAGAWAPPARAVVLGVAGVWRELPIGTLPAVEHALDHVELRPGDHVVLPLGRAEELRLFSFLDLVAELPRERQDLLIHGLRAPALEGRLLALERTVARIAQQLGQQRLEGARGAREARLAAAVAAESGEPVPAARSVPLTAGQATFRAPGSAAPSSSAAETRRLAPPARMLRRLMLGMVAFGLTVAFVAVSIYEMGSRGDDGSAVGVAHDPPTKANEPRSAAHRTHGPVDAVPAPPAVAGRDPTACSGTMLQVTSIETWVRTERDLDQSAARVARLDRGERVCGLVLEGHWWRVAWESSSVRDFWIWGASLEAVATRTG